MPFWFCSGSEVVERLNFWLVVVANALGGVEVILMNVSCCCFKVSVRELKAAA